MRVIKTIFILIFIILICVLYIQNQDIVNYVFKFKIDLPFFKYGPVGIYNIGIIGAAFVAGVIFTLIFGVLRATGKSSEIKSRDKRIKNLENEINHLEKKARENQVKQASASPVSTSSSPFSSAN